jgi:unsaturated rhamnogalacturonyl hydrolase
MLQNSSQVVPPTNSWAIRMADSVLQSYPPSQWEWQYEHGLFVKAVFEVSLVTGEPHYGKFVRDWLDHFITPEGCIRTYRIDEFSLDQINPGKLLFPLYHQTGDKRYFRAIELLVDQLRRQPRTESGGFWHKKIYPYQIWLDGLYMAAPFYAEYALTFGKLAIFEDITRQFILIEQRTRDPETGLLYHAWDESLQQKWADPETGCSPHFWGRAMGWYVMALVDVLDLLPGTHTNRPVLVEILQRLSLALVRFQDLTTGLWFQIVDLPDHSGNYRESSISAMLVYAFTKAVRRGYLPLDYLSVARRAYRGLLENMIKMDARGRLTLDGTCIVAGLGGTPYRDGSFEYYTSEKTNPNDFKGVGPFILAALEIESTEDGNRS